MRSAYSEGVWWSIASGLLLVLPVALCIAWPHAFRWVVALGLASAGTEWMLAYRSNQVDHGGDWQAGGELLAYTGFFAVLYVVIWVAFALLGRIVGLKRAHGT